MDLYELMDLAASLSQRIDNHWALFITVHLALIGGIIYVDRPLKRPEKVVAIAVYSGFAVINFLMMSNQIQFLNSVHQDIVALKDAPCCATSHSLAHIVRVSELGSFKTAVWSLASIHLIMYVLVVLSVLKDGSSLFSDKSEPTR